VRLRAQLRRGARPRPRRVGYNGRMFRLGWPVVLLAIAFVALVARKPGLVFSRAFFPVLLVMGIVFLLGYRPRARRRSGPGERR